MARTGWLSVRIMWSVWDISSHVVSGLISQGRGSTIMPQWVCTVTHRYRSWYDLRWGKNIKPQQPTLRSGVELKIRESPVHIPQPDLLGCIRLTTSDYPDHFHLHLRRSWVSINECACVRNKWWSNPKLKYIYWQLNHTLQPIYIDMV